MKNDSRWETTEDICSDSCVWRLRVADVAKLEGTMFPCTWVTGQGSAGRSTPFQVRHLLGLLYRQSPG